MSSSRSRDLVCPLAEAARRWPNRTGFVCNFKELDQRVRSTATQLTHRGVKQGDRVVFHTLHPWKSLIFLFAIFRTGATAIPLSPKHPETRLQTFLHTLHPCHFLDETLVDHFDAPFSRDVYDRNATALLLLTSGTTKDPKLAALTYDNLYYSAIATLDPLHLSEESCWHLAVPLFHVSGLSIAWRTLLVGARITADEMHLATHFSFVPTQLFRILRDKISLPKAEAILIGGAALAPSLFTKDLPLVTTYGMTETAATVTLDMKPKIVGTNVTSGRVLPFREIKIEEGMISVRGKTLFSGYWNMPPQEGWFATGDLGQKTQDGNLIVTGRADLRFTCLGEKIQPEEIERALLSQPGVENALVVPLDDPERGAVPVAFISCSDPSLFERLPHLLREELLPFKVPRYFFPLPELDGLKPSRKELQKQASILAKDL